MRNEEIERIIAGGGLPPNVAERLKQMAARQGTPEEMFTSTVGASELMLLRQAGWAPLGQVMGVSVFLNDVPTSSAVSGELKIQTRVQNEALHAALKRLREEASLLNAAGVLGVGLRRRRAAAYAGSDAVPLLEYIALGTAVGEPKRARTGGARPFLCSLSGQELGMLHRGGYRPVDLVTGNCAFYRVSALPIRQVALGASNRNRERTDYTDAVYQARRLALERMEQEARQAGAEGIVGVRVRMDVRAGVENGMLCHFFAAGTAVTRRPAAGEDREIGVCVSLE